MRMSAARFYLGCLEAGYRKILLLAFFKKKVGEKRSKYFVFPLNASKYPQPLSQEKFHISIFFLLKTKIIVLTFSH